MSQAEALLNTLSTEDNGIEINDHIVIDNERIITVPDTLKRIAVQYDHNAEIVTFDCPRYWDDIDMSLMKIYINYIRSDSTVGSYYVGDVSIDETDTNIVHFDWSVTRNVTEVAGKLSFLVCAKKVDSEGDEINHWNSELNTDLYISAGLESGDVIVEQYPDVITQILTQLDTGGTTDPVNIAQAIEEYMLANPFTETDPTVPDWAKEPTKPTYTASEVGALPDNTEIPDVPDWALQPTKPTYTASEVGALPDTTDLFSGDYNDLSNKPTIPNVPSWALQPTKPTYTASEVGALPDTTDLFSGDYNDLSNKPTIPTVPSTLPNPQKLIFTGAVTDEYDGSTEKTINIPTASSGGESKGSVNETVIAEGTIPSDLSAWGLVDTGITIKDLREWKKFIIVVVLGTSSYLHINRAELNTNQYPIIQNNENSNVRHMYILEWFDDDKTVLTGTYIGNSGMVQIRNSYIADDLPNTVVSTGGNMGRFGVFKKLNPLYDNNNLKISVVTAQTAEGQWTIHGLLK